MRSASAWISNFANVDVRKHDAQCVPFGSMGDLRAQLIEVCSTPNSGHRKTAAARPKSAMSGSSRHPWKLSMRRRARRDCGQALRQLRDGSVSRSGGLWQRSEQCVRDWVPHTRARAAELRLLACTSGPVASCTWHDAILILASRGADAYYRVTSLGIQCKGLNLFCQA
jgi:hypothetical protein